MLAFFEQSMGFADLLQGQNGANHGPEMTRFDQPHGRRQILIGPPI